MQLAFTIVGGHQSLCNELSSSFSSPFLFFSFFNMLLLLKIPYLASISVRKKMGGVTTSELVPYTYQI